MDSISALTPEGVTPLAAGAVIVASFFTSALTASFGLGGGLALLAIMSALFPPLAVVPVHGVAQLGSNLSRLILQRRTLVWPILLYFSAGSALGSFLGGALYVTAPSWILQAGVGAFVLYSVWGPKPSSFSPGVRTFFATGAVGAFLSMFFGATGPITASMLAHARLDRLQTVATHAGCMVAQHALKVAAFGALGFAFADWGVLIGAVILAGFLGSAVGVRLLRRMPEAQFKTGFRLMLTAIALYLLTSAAIEGVKTS